VAERLTGLEPLQPARREDPPALAAALRRWHGDRPAWARTAGALSAALRGWSWDDMAARIVQLMEGSP
jgi:hypothetical protein